MPDRDVTTIKDLLYYQYAKLIARSAFAVPDGATAKGNFYNFIKQTFHELQNKLFTKGCVMQRKKQRLHLFSRVCFSGLYEARKE